MKKFALTLSLLCATLFVASFAFAADAVAPAKAVKATKAPAKAVAGDKAIAAIDAQIAAAKIDKTKPDWKQHLPKPTKVEFTKGKTYLWKLVTNKGPMVFKFKPEIAPMHVTNFIYLTRMGFYDGLTFHRVIKGFMAQGGDPAGTGGGGPGYSYETETPPGPKHDHRGVLSTARTNDRNTDGSQFFIMFQPYPSLDGQYAIFGDMLEGGPALDAFEAAASPSGGQPNSPLLITKATIEVEDAKK